MERHMSDAKQHIDVLIVVPLAEELDCIYKVFPYESDHSDNGFQFSKVTSPTPTLSTYVIKLKEMGNAAARDACNFVFHNFTVGLVVCYGIAGGLKKDLKLGDVCVSHRVLDLSDQFKIEDKMGALAIAPSPKPLGVDINLCSRFAFMCEHPLYADLREGWKEDCLEFALNVETDHPEEFENFKKHLREDVRVFFGSIVSYAVIASDSFVDTLKSIDRNVLAVESESAGTFEVAANNKTAVICIRGISDYADSKKNQLEVDSKYLVRAIAAMNAALYIQYQLQCAALRGYLADRRATVSQVQSGDLFQKSKTDPLEEVLQQVQEEVELELKEKCPAYRHKPKRSLLPSPRVLREGGASSPEKSEEWDMPREIADIVEQFDRVMISLEPTYPDRALPWVIADIVLRTNGSRIYVPVVVEGDHVSPHRFNLLKLDRVKEVLKSGADCATPVIIVDDPNIQSSTRARALIEEANANPRARFVVLVKKYSAPVLSMNFADNFNCERFSVANFSLGALSNFVSDNFGYDGPQSAVLATKLNDTFEQFKMHAHPSYFAGISPESLSALMAANRRGELIHLAVDAALMIMVAEDEADIQVSKRWRREFLKDIAVRQNVRGESIDEAKAIGIAKEMAEGRDVDIKALEFVQSFVRAGILEFGKNGVEFILVYARDYLVAEYLYENGKAALAYFGFEEIDEDYNVLDMYAELGPSNAIVDTVADLIESDVEYLNRETPETMNNLISNSIQLSEVNNFGRFIERQQRLLEAIEYVGENPADLQRKQYLLDLRRSVSDRAGRRVVEQAEEREVGEGQEQPVEEDEAIEAKADASKVDKTGDGIPRKRISAHWSAGCVLLGAGAEQIEAHGKRRLAKGLIALGCRVAEQWTSEAASIDYEDLRKEILEDPEFGDRKKEMHEDEWTKLRRDFEHLMHLLEFSSVTGPYRTVLTGLCAQASGNVLRKSVKETTVDREFEELTRAVWACEVEAEKADQIFKRSLSRIGHSTILRFVLAEHFISRVYWTKWRQKERNAFLDVATRILNGLDGQPDKGKMRRMIKRTTENS